VDTARRHDLRENVAAGWPTQPSFGWDGPANYLRVPTRAGIAWVGQLVMLKTLYTPYRRLVSHLPWDEAQFKTTARSAGP
jgi:hypothetical protein